jgi:hypothetical protein
MLDSLKPLCQRLSKPLGGRGGRDPFWVLPLYLLQTAEQLVKGFVANFRGILHPIEPIMAVYLFKQMVIIG